MRILGVGFVLLIIFLLMIVDANLKALGWHGSARLFVALFLTFFISVLIAFAGWNGWFTGWGIDAELRQ